MNSMKKLVLQVLILAIFLAPAASATYLDVSIALSKLVYESGDEVNVTGYVTTLPPDYLAVPGMSVEINITNSSGSLVFRNTTTTSASGFYYTPTPYTTTTVGAYDIRVHAANSTHNGTAMGSFEVAPNTIYSLTTNKYTYSTNETVAITLTVYEVESDGSLVPKSGESVYVQIKRADGTIVSSSEVTTNSNGQGTMQYTIPVSSDSYAVYTVIAGAGLTFATFEVPSFNIGVELRGANDEIKNTFSANDRLKVRSVASITSESGGVIPVSDATVTATLKNPQGTTFATFTSANFTETSEGTYESSLLYLNSTTIASGDYYIEVQVTKSGLTQSKKAWFQVKNLKLDMVPYSSKPNIKGFLVNKTVSLGLIVVDLRTGQTIEGEQISSAAIVSCKDSGNQNCMSQLSSTGTLVSVDKPDFARALVFTAMNKTGSFTFEVEVNTSTGSSVRGSVVITLQRILSYLQTEDQYGEMRQNFAPGEVVVLKAYAVTGNWADATSDITSVSLSEVRDGSWNDVTSQFSAATSNVTLNKLSLSWSNTSVNQPTGWYSVKVKVNTTLGTAYAVGTFLTKKFDTMIDTRDSEGNWQWQFSSNDVVYFYYEVFKLSGQELDASEYSVSLRSLKDEFSGETYSGATIVSNGTSSSGKKIMKMNLSTLNVDSSIYRANFKITDLSGNEDYTDAWFKVSSLDMWVITKRGSNQRNSFAPTDNVTLELHANYFNGSAIPEGSNATVESLMYIEQGPPTPVPESMYLDPGTVDVTSGVGTLWVKAAQGESFSQGDYISMIRVYANDSSGNSDLAEGWFRVTVLSATANANPRTVSSGQNVTITVSVTKNDGTPVENASITVDEIFSEDTWSQQDDVNADTAYSDSSGTAALTFSTSTLSTGNYIAELMMYSSSLGARTRIGAPFSIRDFQITGDLKDQSQTVYASGSNVVYDIYVNYSNGTPAVNRTVSIYKLVNTDGWPWDYIDAITRVTGTVDNNGLARVTVQAPTDGGIFYPLVRLTLDNNVTYNSTDIFALQPFEVQNLKVIMKLFDYEGTQTNVFGLNENITVNFNVSNPGGGEVTLNRIELVSYKNLANNQETTLGLRRTSNLDSIENMTFTSPSSAGDYVLNVQVEDNSTGDIISKQVWFKVESMNYYINHWMNQWEHQKNQATAVTVEAFDYNGASATVMIDGISIRDPWTQTEVVADESLSEQNITGFGYYNFTTPNQTGEFEIELCFYSSGSSCSSDSERRYQHFSVGSFNAWMWPSQPTYTQNQVVELRVMVPGTGGAAEFDTSFLGLYRMPNQVDVTSNIIVPTGTNDMFEKVLNFSAQNLSTGEYMARVNVTMSGESKTVSVWFTINDYTMTVDTIPSTKYGERRFFVGQNITFNFSVGDNLTSGDMDGSWELRNDFTWALLQSGNYTIENGSSEAHVNITVNNNGHYGLEARAGSAMDFFWFEAGAYKIEFDPSQSTFDVPSGENVTVAFNMYYPNGSEYTGNVTFDVLRLRNTWDWTIVPGTEGLYSENVSAGLGAEVVTFDPSLSQGGEFEAELRFTANGKSTDKFFWFRTVTKQFWAWPLQPSYSPGDTVYINAYLAYPNGTPMEGVDVSIEQVTNTMNWNPLSVANWTNRTNTTNANGETIVSFVMPASAGNGNFEVRLNESDAGDKTFTMLQVSGYNFNFERLNWKWSYTPGENFSGNLYVYDSDFIPKPNVMVNISVYSQNDWSTPVAEYGMGLTDSNGYALVTFPVGSTTGDFRAKISVADGALWFDEFYSVDAMSVITVARGESSGSSTLASNDTVILTVTAEYPNGSRIQGANVSIHDLRYLDGWVQTNYSSIQDNRVTDSNGRAVLKIQAPQTYGDYILRANVTNEGSEVITEDGWFRVSQYSSSITLNCPANAGSNCEPQTRSPDTEMLVTATLSNAQENDKVCLRKIHSISKGWDQFYDQCYYFSAGQESVNISFWVPMEAGDYDAVFQFRDSNNNYIDEVWEWFRVVGGSGLEMNTWVEPNNAWPGRNATINVEIWDISNWYDVNELDLCDDITVDYIRNPQTGGIVTNNVTQQNATQGSMFGPPAAQVTFTLPDTLEPGDYMARVVAENCAGQNLTADAFFRATAFQASSLMSETLKMNRNVSFWIKVTNATGGPIENATVYQRKLVDAWSMSELTTYNISYQSNSYGEVTGSFLTPNYPGEFMLKLRVDDGSQTQNIDRFFRIEQLIVDLDFGGRQVFYEGNTVTLNVLVRDAVTNLPVGDANIWLDVMKHDFMGGDAMQAPEEQVDCFQYQEAGSCNNESACAWFDMGWGFSCKPENEYYCYTNFTNEQACEDDELCFWDGYDQKCKEDLSQSSGGIDMGGAHYQATTSYDGVATFIFAGSTALTSGEYEVNANVNTMNGGWAWSHKSFMVKKWRLDLTTDKFYYSPGEEVQVTITGNYTNGTPLPDSTTITAGLESMDFTKSGDKCMMYWNQTECENDVSCEWFSEEGPGFCEPVAADMDEQNTTMTSGVATLNLSIAANASAGPTILFVDIRNIETNKTDFMDYMVIVTSNSSYNVSNIGNVSPGSLFDVNITASKAEMAMAPFVQHLEKTGNAVSMSQMMGGGPQSGKEDFYESPMYFTENKDIHYMALSRDRKACYLGLQPIIQQNTDWAMDGPMAFDDIILIDYCVNSSTGECRQDYQCSDGNASTADFCVFFECQHYDASSLECEFDYECNNASNSETTEVCWQGSCMTVQGSECEFDWQCDDQNSQTIDQCENFECKYQNSSSLECYSDFDCDDFDSSTTNICEYGICTYPDSSNIECTKNVQCNDNNASTYDWCDRSNYKCVNQDASSAECTSSYDCDDSDANTVDLCMNGVCHNQDSSSFECTADSECDDNNPSTYDFCDDYSYMCIHTSGSECTPENVDTTCTNKNDSQIALCWDGWCEYIDNSTIECYTDSDCNNTNETNQGFCTGFVCQYGEGECMMDSDCTDGNSTTIDICDMGLCKYYTSAQLNWFVDWSQVGNLPGVNFSMMGPEMADEQNPWGNPAADIIGAKMTNDSTNLYMQLKTGPMKDLFGGLTQCGGNMRSNVTYQWYEFYLNSTGGAGSDEANFTDMDYKFRLNVNRTNRTLQTYDWSGSWSSAVLGAQYKMECKTSTIDIVVPMGNVSVTNQSLQSIFAIWTSLGLSDRAPDSSIFEYNVTGSGGSQESVSEDGNDDFSEAAWITLGVAVTDSLNVSFNDSADYFKFNGSLGQTILGDLLIENDSNDFDMYLYNSSYSIIAAANSSSQNDSFTSNPLSANGTYYVKVMLLNGYGNYTINLSNGSMSGPMINVGNDTVGDVALESVDMEKLYAGSSASAITSRMGLVNLSTNLSSCGGTWSNDSELFYYRVQFDTAPGGYGLDEMAKNGTDYMIVWYANATTNGTIFYYANTTSMIENATNSPKVDYTLNCMMDEIEIGINLSYIGLSGTELINMSFSTLLNSSLYDNAPNGTTQWYQYDLNGGG